VTGHAVLLVHSPLLARSSWGGVPARLAELGYAVAVPDLRPVLDPGPPFYERLFRVIAASAAGDGAVGVVGHSRAGPLLPGAPARIGAGQATAVFLDARLPHDGRTWVGDADGGSARDAARVRRGRPPAVLGPLVSPRGARRTAAGRGGPATVPGRDARPAGGVAHRVDAAVPAGRSRRHGIRAAERGLRGDRRPGRGRGLAGGAVCDGPSGRPRAAAAVASPRTAPGGPRRTPGRREPGETHVLLWDS
jgi:hypothetical protein